MNNFKHLRYLLITLAMLLIVLGAVACDTNKGSETTEGTTETAEPCLHENTEWVIDTPATCSAEGSSHKECRSCKASLETATIAKTAHTEEKLEGKAASCTETGITEGKKCSVCNEILVAQEEIALINHTEVILESKAPTCSEKGLTEGKKCSVCNEIITAQAEIDTIPHTEILLEAIKPGCTEKGLTEGKKCSACDTVIVSQEEVDALGHTESDWIIDKAADVGVEGSKHKNCVRCGKVYDSVVIPAITEEHVHNGENWVVATPATCAAEGEKHLVCSCGKTIETAKVEKLAHTPTESLGIAATCSATGLTAGKKCAECNEIIEGCETIEKLPHTKEAILAVSPTCSANGLTAGEKCSVCGEITVAQQPIAMLPHTEENVLGKTPNCTEEGSTDYKKCSVCQANTSTPVILPPTGHTFVSGACVSCGTKEAHGIWIVDGLGFPVKDVIVKLFKDGEMVKMMPYRGEFLSFGVETSSYTIELDLEGTGVSYVYDEAALSISPDKLSTTVRLFKTTEATESIFVGAPVSSDYDAYIVDEGSYKVSLTPGDRTYFIFIPKSPAIYTITYECDTSLTVSYHGSTFFVQGMDVSAGASDIAKYGNGLSINVYESNIGGDLVFAISSKTATECILNIQNAGDPGTRLVDQPWVPYLEDEAKLQADLALKPEGTYTAIDVTDMSVSAVYNKNDGYYHLGSEDGPVIFIDLTSENKYIASIQKICSNQRMGAYIYDGNGNVVEKRSYNELFMQYGMPFEETPEEPVRVPLTAKMAEAIKSFGDKNGWWSDDPDVNIFTRVLMGASYNPDAAWLLFCGYYK